MSPDSRGKVLQMKRCWIVFLVLALLTAWIPAPAGGETEAEIPSLKEAYAGKFDFGAAMSQSSLTDLKLRELIIRQFSIMTPGNELKPASLLDINKCRELAKEDDTAVAVKFTGVKAMLDFAQKNGIKIHGHVLVWHEQTPEAFFHLGYDTKQPFVSREVMLQRLENYIREVLTWTQEKYPGLTVSWDVVNEAIDDGSGWLRKSNWYKVVGEDFVARAFEYARKYAAEGVLLYYNDYNTAYAGKLNGIVRLLNQLIAEGNIDGYGFQMHHSIGEPSMGMITQAVERIAGLGLRLRVSELDITIRNKTEDSLQRQKEKYKAVMELMLRYSDQTEAVQVWGTTDNTSWRAKNYPLLFDKFMDPKPAFYGVLEAAEEN